MRLVRASEMQEMDRMAINELGMPGAVLMENAARGASRIFLEHYEPDTGSNVMILCGRGNNGGDGYVMSRYLHQAGLRVSVIVLSLLDKIAGDARINLDIIRKIGLEVKQVPGVEEWAALRKNLDACDIIVDGIFGTGLNSDVRGFYVQVFDDVNSSGKRVMAIDIPSGVNADTGHVMGAAIKADLTVTFGYPKLGHLLFPGSDLVGRLARIDIGIPNSIAAKIPAEFHLVEPDDFSFMFKEDKKDIHKGSRGHLLILAGSRGKTGAAALTSLAALRAGAGLVTLGIPESLNHIMEMKLTEAMTCPLPETKEGTLALGAEKEVKKLLDGKTALAIGPGLSNNKETSSLVRIILRECPLTTVIDADGINNIADDLRILNNNSAHKVLTPHPGEMGRLIGLGSKDVQTDRIGVARRFVKEHGCHLILKGARTIMADPDGHIFINPTANPALSSGGSGDVLTGLISGFICRGWPVNMAIIAGVYMHGLAADALSEEMGQAGILAGELLDVIPELINSLSRNEWPLNDLPGYVDLYQPL